MKLHCIILAAGQGTRMKSALPKVLHPVGGTPMLGHVLKACREAEAAAIHVVLGHAADQVESWMESAGWGHVNVVLQQQQQGTGHAVLQAVPGVPDGATVVVLYGDVPLVTADTIRRLAKAASGGLALVTATLEQPFGYGRILRAAGRDDGQPGRVEGIVEEKDATSEQRAIHEINTGLLAGQSRRLKRWLSHVKNHNAKREYYLTDIVAMANGDAVDVQTIQAGSPDEVEGVNDRAQLSLAERRFQRRQAEQFQREGLSIADPGRFDVRGSLKFGADVFVDIGCVFEGTVELGDQASIGPYTLIKNARIGPGTRIEGHSVIDTAETGRDCRIGPFARLRPDAQLGDHVHIGNFVEIKKSIIGDQSKANHLAYVGDATVGARVNIGAGVITCNYDGANKHATIIGDDVFIGSDSQLIAPIIVGRGAYIAAGSSIAKEAPEDALTVCRAREQRSIKGWKRPRKKQ